MPQVVCHLRLLCTIQLVLSGAKLGFAGNCFRKCLTNNYPVACACARCFSSSAQASLSFSRSSCCSCTEFCFLWCLSLLDSKGKIVLTKIFSNWNTFLAVSEVSTNSLLSQRTLQPDVQTPSDSLGHRVERHPGCPGFCGAAPFASHGLRLEFLLYELMQVSGRSVFSWSSKLLGFLMMIFSLFFTLGFERDLIANCCWSPQLGQFQTLKSPIGKEGANLLGCSGWTNMSKERWTFLRTGT